MVQQERNESILQQLTKPVRPAKAAPSKAKLLNSPCPHDTRQVSLPPH